MARKGGLDSPTNSLDYRLMPALITAGVPVYNNGATLTRAVESLLAQTLPPVRIEISDNATSDSTEQVGRALAAQYPCVHFTRQPANLGPPGNFSFVLQRAETPYFMWLAADDYILPSYLEKTSGYLDAHPDVTTCVSQVQFTQKGEPHGLASGGWPLQDDTSANLAKYLDNPGANARLYGLHRTEVLRRAFPPGRFHAYGWAVMAGTLLSGKHEEIPEVLMFRDETPRINYVRQVRQDNPRAFGRIFPLMPMTKDLLLRQRIPLDLKIIRALIKINLDHHCWYMAEYHPFYAKLIGKRIAGQLWRLEQKVAGRCAEAPDPSRPQ
jgi:glycosyltransferase involved in cell wall biosynthesis